MTNIKEGLSWGILCMFLNISQVFLDMLIVFCYDSATTLVCTREENMSEEMEVITVRVTPEFKKEIEELAKINHQTVSGMTKFLWKREVEDIMQRKDFGDFKDVKNPRA